MIDGERWMEDGEKVSDYQPLKDISVHHSLTTGDEKSGHC
jgi:hypothetical protein